MFAMISVIEEDVSSELTASSSPATMSVSLESFTSLMISCSLAVNLLKPVTRPATSSLPSTLMRCVKSASQLAMPFIVLFTVRTGATIERERKAATMAETTKLITARIIIVNIFLNTTE